MKKQKWIARIKNEIEDLMADAKKYSILATQDTNERRCNMEVVGQCYTLIAELKEKLANATKGDL